MAGRRSKRSLVLGVAGLAALLGGLAGCQGSPRGADPAGSPSPISTPGPSSSPAPSAIPGRPVRRGRRTLLPGLGRADRALPRQERCPLPIPAAETLEALPEATRRALGGRWAASARGELASVPAFAELALTLSALGAPLDLVERAHEAALDEIDHTRRSLAIAGAYLNDLLQPGAMPDLLKGRTRWGGAHASVACESLRDGCLLEAWMAQVAVLAAARAVDPALRESLAVIAADETRHGDLSWDIVAWCVRTGGGYVRTRLRWTLAHLPTEVAFAGVEDCDPGLAEAHGWPRGAGDQERFTAHRAEVISRARALLRDRS